MNVLIGLAVVLAVVGLLLTAYVFGSIGLAKLRESKKVNRLADDLARVTDEQPYEDENATAGRGLMAVAEQFQGAHAAVKARLMAERPRSLDGPPPLSSRAATRDAEAGQESGIRPILLSEAMELIEKAHHVAILGGTGDGKTWTGEAILRLLPIDQLFCVIDPNWEPGKWRGIPVITTDEADGFAPILHALHGIQKEARQRKLRTWKEEDRGQVLNIFWDEVNETMEEVDRAGEYLRRWLRRVRYLRMKLWIFPQSERVGALGLDGHGDAKKNMLWLYIGEDARAKAEWMLSKKKTTPEMAEWLMRQDRPCLIEWQRGFYVIDLSEVPTLVRQPIANIEQRSWRPTGSITRGEEHDDLALSEEEQNELEVRDLEHVSGTQSSAKSIEAQIKARMASQMNWTLFAQQVLDGTATEGDLIFQLFEVKPGGSPVYAAAKTALQSAIAQLQHQGQEVS